MFDYYVAWIIGIMLLTILCMSYYLWDAHRDKKLFKHLSWCLSEEPRLALRRYDNMRTKIWTAQRYLPTEDYRIERGKENELVYDILKEFYDFVCVNYFSERFTLSRASDKLNDGEYFMHLFEQYLRYDFKSNDLFNVETTESGERIKNITTLGVVYYKLILISSLYNRSKDRTAQMLHYGDTDSIIEILDQAKETKSRRGAVTEDKIKIPVHVGRG